MKSGCILCVITSTFYIPTR